MYSYIGRVAAEPISWACVALLIGHIRSQQIAQVDQLQTELAERIAHGTAVADLCVDLRGRTELLERHIAASAPLVQCRHCGSDARAARFDVG